MGRGLTTDLAELATTLELRNLPEAARAAARWGITDAVACAVAGASEGSARIVREWIEVDRGPGPVAIWSTPSTSSAAGAALANGTAAHALDFDDVCWAMNAHASAVLAPAVLALGEALGASGARVLAAYVAGFEVAGRLGEALGHVHYEAGWHPTITLGTFGATAAAGVLMGLQSDALARAFGIACSLSAGSRMQFGTDVKPLHAGLAAQAGVTAAELAARGMGARTDGFEAPFGFAALHHAHPGVARMDESRLCLVDPGIEHKPYPSCRFTHRVLDAIVALAARNASRVPRAITCHVDPFSRSILLYGRPRTGLEAKFSMQGCAALGWLDGPPGPPCFRDERIQQVDLQQLIERVALVDGNAETESVHVAFEDGSADQETVRHPRGHPRRPLSVDEHLEKVRSCTVPTLGSARTDDLVAHLMSLEDVSDVSDVTRLLRQDPAR